MDRERKGLDPEAAHAFAFGGRSGAVDRLVTPRWYHPVSGLALALLVGSWGTREPALVGACALVWFVTLVALPRLYRRSVGVWYTGPTPPRSRRTARALSATTAGGLTLGVVSSTADALLPLAPVVAVVCFVLVQVLGRRFDETLREELRDDPTAGLALEER